MTGAAVNVQYALEHLLVAGTGLWGHLSLMRSCHGACQCSRRVDAGSCKDVTNEDHPAGLQLVLGTPEQAHTQDTLVMANLGYFQLKVPLVFCSTVSAHVYYKRFSLSIVAAHWLPDHAGVSGCLDPEAGRKPSQPTVSNNHQRHLRG